MVVHVDAEALAAADSAGVSTLEDGTGVSAETSRRLACDASRVEMRHGPDGSVLDVGRRRRTVPPALRRALDHRDGGCRFPGCASTLCDAHHVEHWADGGETKLDNLVKLCRFHHRAVHEGGLTVELLPSGEARFARRNGRPIRRAPPLPAVAGDAAAVLAARLADEGIALDPDAGLPTWDGRPVEIGWAVEWLREVEGG